MQFLIFGKRESHTIICIARVTRGDSYFSVREKTLNETSHTVKIQRQMSTTGMYNFDSIIEKQCLV